MNKEELININGIREDLYQAMQIGDITLNSKHSQELYDFMNYQDKEIERIKQEHEAIKKYVHNHTITYIDNGIECCKPDEYFNISYVEDMLNGNFENLDVLFEDSDK